MTVYRNKIKGILFDVDGVLVRNEDYFSVQYAREVGITNDDMIPFFTGVFREASRGKADLKKIIQPYLEGWKWNGTVDAFLRHWFQIEHNIDEKAVEYVRELQSQGMQCTLASDQEKYRAKYIARDMGLDKIFETMYFSCDLGYVKTDLEFWKFVCEDISQRNKVKRHEILVVDDDEDVVKTAKRFGLQGYMYTELDKFREDIERLNFGV